MSFYEFKINNICQHLAITKCLMVPRPEFICLKYHVVITLQHCSYWEESQCPSCSEPAATPSVLVSAYFLPLQELQKTWEMVNCLIMDFLWGVINS